MPRKAGARDVAPRIRGAFLAALDNGKLHEKMKQSLDKDFIGTLNAVAKFVPKELLLQGDDEQPLNWNLTVEYRTPDGD